MKAITGLCSAVDVHQQMQVRNGDDEIENHGVVASWWAVNCLCVFILRSQRTSAAFMLSPKQDNTKRTMMRLS